MRVAIVIAATVGAVGAAAVPARAGNEDSFLFGDQAAMTGGAVVASTSTTASIWYNPAGLGLNDRGRLDLSGTAFTLRYRSIPGGLAIDLPSGRVDRSITSRQVYVVPTTIATARELRPGLSLGAGLFVTEQDLFSFKRSTQIADATTSLDLAGALTGTLIRYHAGPAIGWQASPRVRIGASLFGVYEDYRELRKLFVDATSTGTYGTTFLQRLVDARASRLGLELLAGVQIDAGAWQIGLTARSPRLVFREVASTDNSTVLVSKSATAPEIAASNVDRTPIGAERTGFTRPAQFVAGVARRVGPVAIAGEVELRPPGTGVTAQRTVWNVRAGALWYPSTRTELGLGVFTDRSGAAPPATFPDARVHYYGASAGWKRHNTVKLRAGESASTLLFSTTIAIRYAVGLGESTRIRFDFTDTADTGDVGRVADERSGVVYHELSVYVGTGLEF